MPGGNIRSCVDRSDSDRRKKATLVTALENWSLPG
jgi:hypothetical protein